MVFVFCGCLVFSFVVIYLFLKSFIKQLICTWHCSRHLGYSSEQFVDVLIQEYKI